VMLDNVGIKHAFCLWKIKHSIAHRLSTCSWTVFKLSLKVLHR
jgi:hypothetical protein